MTHPITPSSELVQQWRDEWHRIDLPVKKLPRFDAFIAARAAQWGSDQELKACVEWLRQQGHDSFYREDLRAARRPKPPSAVAQAEALIERYEDGWCPSPAQWHIIREGLAEGRRALEQLDD